MNAAGEDFKFAADAIWKVLIAAVVLGAGLPILFASGLRSLAWGKGGSAETVMVDGQPERGNPFGAALAVLLFAIVIYGIAAGIVYVIATGKGSNYDIGFNHLIPVIVKTK
jgi:hypothetical protein